MKRDIPLIGNYCDSWCERCAFTSRCAVFRVRIAVEMCGDRTGGLELALGRPHPASNAPPPDRSSHLEGFVEPVMSPAEEAEYARAEAARRARIRESPVARLSEAAAMVAWLWLRSRDEARVPTADAVLGEALEIVQHDTTFVPAKLKRALDGQDRFHYDAEDDEPVQNDWNGSAKIALISLVRSEAAWRTIAAATGDETAAELANRHGALRREVEKAFPDAWTFVRPGFDEPGR